MASLLVLGGTAWLGGAVASAAAPAHDVVCLARGESGTVPSGVRLVRADRAHADAYDVLGDATWDLVVDVTRHPGHARGALAALSERAAHWVFVSSASVYARHDIPGADESSALLPPLEGDVATPEQYGEAKVACEAAVLAARGADSLIARSGLIVGAGDPSERFGYWPGRFAQAAVDGRPVLVPERTDRRVQWVDVADLATWILEAGLAGTTGVCTAIGPVTTLQSVLDGAAQVSGFSGAVVTASDAALAAAGVREFMGPRSLPLWISDPESQAFMDRSGAAAAARGLRHRPLQDCLCDALRWERRLGLARVRTRAGLDREDERAVIAAL